jgi:sugar phosphate isomerase/epimerase
MPLAAFLTLATAHGCRDVELRAAAGEPVHVGLDAPERRAVRRACERDGIRIVAVASYVRIASVDPAGQALSDHLRLAADLGAKGVRVFAGGDGSAEAEARAVRRLAEAADLADALGVRLLLETHDSHPRGEDVARLLGHIDLTGAPVGAIWDLVHPWVVGEDPTETWRHLAPYLSHVQIKDIATRRLGATPVLAGTGVMPLDEIAEVLREHDYAGPLVLEWEKPWHQDIPDLEDALAAAARWLAGR